MTDVRYDGRSILFAMRVGKQDSLNIYELQLDERLDYVKDSFRRLTYGADTRNGLRLNWAHNSTRRGSETVTRRAR